MLGKYLIVCPFVAENACSAEEVLACDGGNNRTTCARDVVNGGTICNCPKGFALDSQKNCQG